MVIGVSPRLGMTRMIALEKGASYRVRNTVSRVQDATGRTSRGIQGKDSLDIYIHGRDIESLEHDLRHTFAVSLGVLGSLGKEDGVSFGSHTEFVVESVVPNLFHVIPIGDNTVLEDSGEKMTVETSKKEDDSQPSARRRVAAYLDGILQREDTTLGLGFVTDIGVTLLHTNHNAGLAGCGAEESRWVSDRRGTDASQCPFRLLASSYLPRPINEGKTERGASSPANPALHIPEPV